MVVQVLRLFLAQQPPSAFYTAGLHARTHMMHGERKSEKERKREREKERMHNMNITLTVYTRGGSSVRQGVG